MDHQFIHVNQTEAAPLFSATIAYGFLCLSLIEGILFQQKIGLIITEKKPEQFLVKNSVTMEIKGIEKPAIAAETLSMFIT